MKNESLLKASAWLDWIIRISLLVALFIGFYKLASAYVPDVTASWVNQSVTHSNVIGVSLTAPTEEAGFVPDQTIEVPIGAEAVFIIPPELLKVGKTYYFAVQAKSRSGLLSPWTYKMKNGEVAKVDLIPPEEPTDFYISIKIITGNISISIDTGE